MIKVPEEKKTGVKKEAFLKEVEKHTSFDILQKNLYEIERKLDIIVSKYQFIAHV